MLMNKENLPFCKIIHYLKTDPIIQKSKPKSDRHGSKNLL
jgi:hypothetical protein